MRKSIFLFPILLLFLLSSCGSSEKYPRSTPEELGETLFMVVKNKDKEGLRTLLPTKEDMRTFFQQLPLSPDEKANFDENFEKEWQSIQANMENNIFGEFDPMMEEMGRKLDMPIAELEKVEVNAENLNPPSGIQVADISVFFKAGEEEVELRSRGCIKFESGWTISPDGFRIR